MKLSENAKLLKEWDKEKNKDLNPNDFHSGSNKKVFWICEKNHSYLAPICDRTRTDGKATGCPYCANKKVLSGYNDLQTVRPEVIKEWDFEKNDKLPSEYLPHTDKKVFWKCEKGHSYPMRICDKTKDKPYGCPVCSNKKLLVGYNDLKTLFPEVADEWNYDKNDTIPEDHIAGSHKKVYWKCKRCGNEWKAQIKERTYGATGCPNCAHYYKTSIPEQAIYYYVKQIFPDAVNSYRPNFLNGMEIDVYIPKQKIGIEYDGRLWHYNEERDRRKSDLLKKNNIRLIRIKELDNTNNYCDYKVIKSEYKDDIRVLTPTINKLLDILDYPTKHNIDILSDSNIIYSMSTERKLQKSLLASGSEVLKEWNYKMNGLLTPDLVTPGSRKMVWWHCSVCGKDWQQSIKTKVKGGLKCSSCSYSNENHKRTINKIKNGLVKSIADYPNLLKEWNDVRDPSTVSRGSNYKAKWKCSVCGNEFEQFVKNRTIQNQGCPKCGIKKSAATRRKKKPQEI